MSEVWAWVAGIFVGLCIIGLLVYGGSERRAYWIARGHIVVQHIQVTPHPANGPIQRSPGR